MGDSYIKQLQDECDDLRKQLDAAKMRIKAMQRSHRGLEVDNENLRIKLTNLQEIKNGKQRQTTN